MRSGRRLVRLHTLALALLLAFPSHLVFAKGSGESDVARSERTKGTVALNLGQYDEAVEHFSQAYALTQDPILLFNLGQAHRLAGRGDKAVASYSSFLRAAGSISKFRVQFERAATEIEAIAPTLVCRPGDRVNAGKQFDDSKQLEELMNAPAAKRASAPPPIEPPSPPSLDEVIEPPPPAAEAPRPTLAPTPPPAPAPALALSAQASPPVESNSSPFYKKGWFWTSVAVALAVGGVATWYFTRSQNETPGSTYGSTRVLP